MCVDTMNCGGQCPECKENAERLRRRHEGTLKMMATKAAKRAAIAAEIRSPVEKQRCNHYPGQTECDWCRPFWRNRGDETDWHEPNHPSEIVK